jgi:MATE family multidrug resistance protein
MKNLTPEIKILLKLSIPLILMGFVESSVGFFSTIFLAHLGPQELAAGAVVSRTFVTLMVVVWGALCSISIVVAQKYGAKDHQGIAQVLYDGLFLSILCVIPASLLLWNISPILLLTGQDPATVALAQKYMRGLVWSFFPDFTGLVLVQLLIGLGHTRASVVYALFWVPLNIGANYIFMFGKFGFPAWGIAGIGWGTTVSYWISTIVLLVYFLIIPEYRQYLQGIWSYRPRLLGELCLIGIPIGIMYCVELAFFLALTLLMGHLGSEMLGANQIVLQYLMQLATAVFAIAQAVTVRIGHSLGARDIHTAKLTGEVGVLIAVALMGLAAIVYWFFPLQLISLDLSVQDPKNALIISYTKQFLIIAAIFQVIEGTRIILFGALRGFNDTRFTLLTSIVSFWFVALPIGYGFGTFFNRGGVGLWWGMVLGAICGVMILYYRLQFKINQYKRHHI